MYVIRPVMSVHILCASSEKTCAARCMFFRGAYIPLEWRQGWRLFFEVVILSR